QQPPRKPAPRPKPAGPAPAPPEPPKPPANPRARLCLSCHNPITDPEAKACPECGFALMEVPGFTPKPVSPSAPPISSAPPVPPPPPAAPASPPSPPQAAPPKAPPQPLDLEATVRVGPPRLTSTAPDGRPESYTLRLPLNKIGRKNDNDLAFPLERTISGRHCEIYQEGKDWFIKDLASTNGVLVNGKKVETSPLKEGDQLKLGNKIFTFTRSG
ncbi:MAG: FHA domain-containing protein, partial [Deltaproteobacteria bacterium]|nr:FHA domain-containing protein [Deltaproteobacteria bacterium]